MNVHLLISCAIVNHAVMTAVCTAFSLIYFYFHHLSLVGHGGKKALVYPSTVSPSVWAMH